MASAIISVGPVGFPLEAPDPFLFCVYHKDAYPAGNAKMEAPRRGNGADFDFAAPYRMYHGDHTPGFPQHPHRGFETLTFVPSGVCDHTDSAGNSGRFGGGGDLMWMTAGKGIVHGEMFPLVHADKPNPLVLFQGRLVSVDASRLLVASASAPPTAPQIWLNLPARSKMVEPAFAMQWAEDVRRVRGSSGAETWVVAGAHGSLDAAMPAPPSSWGADPANDVAVYYVTLPAGGSAVTLPPARAGLRARRRIFVVEGGAGGSVRVAGTPLPAGTATVEVRGDSEVIVSNDDASAPALALVLQGVPIGEPVAQRGPFVMNTQAEIHRAYADYQATRFGGWPWPEDAVVFPREQGRFASHAGGAKGAPARVEVPPPLASAAAASPSGVAGGVARSDL